MCQALGSSLYEELLSAAAHDVEQGGAAWSLLQGHEDDAPGSRLGFRLMGRCTDWSSKGGRPRSRATTPPWAGTHEEAAEAALLTVLAESREELRQLIDHPFQTNEVGRSAALLGGFLVIARELRLPLRLLELGASAGLNLRWDRYRYDFGGPH